jgi:glycogen operon protein
MTEADWRGGVAGSLGVYLNGEGIASPGPMGEQVVDDTFYLMFNPRTEAVDFKLPPRRWGGSWAAVLDTADGVLGGDGTTFRAGSVVSVGSWSLVVLKRRTTVRTRAGTEARPWAGR